MKFIQPDWQAPANIKAYTTLRTGWGSYIQQHDVNKGYIFDNDEISQRENRHLVELLQLPEDPIWIHQKHGTIALEATPANKEKIADASFTSLPNRVCVVLTADCLPLLICNKQGSHVAAIHAGWRGLSAGVIEATINSLNQTPENLLVWLGPAIGPLKFEVGKDVYDAFTAKHAEAATAFTPHVEGKWMANLYDLARLRLEKLGVKNITGGNFCTYTQDELFFSYRRDKGKTGRMASVIWVENHS